MHFAACGPSYTVVFTGTPDAELGILDDPTVDGTSDKDVAAATKGQVPEKAREDFDNADFSRATAMGGPPLVQSSRASFGSFVSILARFLQNRLHLA